MQTAALRYELADQHTYRFLQGVVPWSLVPGLESLSDQSAEHYAYYNVGAGAASSIAIALDQLEAYIALEGPFDGVLGFSQGAGLAIMLLVRRYHGDPVAPPPFKCAILFSPVSVYDPVAYEKRGQVRLLDGTLDGKYSITIPTAIIYGKEDSRKQECEGLLSSCDPTKRSVLIHEGNHEIPGIGLRSELAGTVNMVRRAIYQAELQSSTE
ncbi:DUF341-domain-containing protein [Venustampulla echinocandica]|uniref:DUF341-domain-containing protein n=1 Tax=Venustampulla echinocandica TaxID=2656787 RepID=A0A370TU73_9HELO|nr:DUF341-domain-containing protein [Venustampulla echinocandica]RDL39060.1 DUF341-domain-containing protein [Venustampulla echinocandica]